MPWNFRPVNLGTEEDQYRGLRFQMDNYAYSIVAQLANIEASPYCESAFRWACHWSGELVPEEDPLILEIPLIDVLITFITTPFTKEQKAKMSRKLGRACTCPPLIKKFHEAGDELSNYVEPPDFNPLSSVMGTVWSLIISFCKLGVKESVSLLSPRFESTFRRRVSSDPKRTLDAFLGWMTDDREGVHRPIYVFSWVFRLSSTIRRCFFSNPAFKLKDVIFQVLKEEIELKPGGLTPIGIVLTLAFAELGLNSNLDAISSILFQGDIETSFRRYLLLARLLELAKISEIVGLTSCQGMANLAKVCHVQLDLHYSRFQWIINRHADSKLFRVPTVDDEIEDLEDITTYDLVNPYVHYSKKFGSICHYAAGHKQNPYILRDVKVCARCRVTRYCSQTCQKEDWEKHKVVCRRLREGKELTLAEPPDEEDEGYDEWYRVVDEWDEDVSEDEFGEIFLYTTAIRAQIFYKC